MYMLNKGTLCNRSQNAIDEGHPSIFNGPIAHRRTCPVGNIRGNEPSSTVIFCMVKKKYRKNI